MEVDLRNILLSLILLLVIPIAYSSEEIKEIRWGTEVWKGYTDEDGSGIFTKVLKRIFESQGIKLSKRIYPIKRAIHLTRNGQLDLAGGIPKDLEKSTQHIQAKYPILVSRISAFYHKDTIKHWDGLNSTQNKEIVSTHIVGGMIGLKTTEYLEVSTRKQTINLVLKKRFDLYIDDEKLLLSTIAHHRGKFNENDYRVNTVVTKGWYFISTNNERGRKIITIFEKGMEQLKKSGELKELYDSAGFSPPLIDVPL